RQPGSSYQRLNCLTIGVLLLHCGEGLADIMPERMVRALVCRDEKLLLPIHAFDCSRVYFDYRMSIGVSFRLRDDGACHLDRANLPTGSVLTRDHGEWLGITARSDGQYPRGDEQQQCFPAHLIK